MFVRGRRLLAIDDDPFMLTFLGKYFAREGYDFVPFQSASKALALLKEQDASNAVDGRIHCVLCDVNMPNVDGFEVLAKIKTINPDLPVIMITGFGSVESAIKAIKKGAYDYVTKPLQLKELKSTIDNALEFQTLISSSINLPFKTAPKSERTGTQFGIVGSSPVMENLYNIIFRVAHTSASLLITGESGTGKELVARAIHASSTRGAGPFLAINCAALPEELLESELFGHAKGSFTGATSEKKGLFAEADNGTVFLDEIGDMSLATQAKLLRVVQEKKVRPVGATSDIAVNVRILSATHRDLKELVHEGLFRADLFYRISVIPISVPPLRARGDDIVLLAEFFLKRVTLREGMKAQHFTESAVKVLKNYTWRGNVRELENVVERAAALTESATIDEDQLGLILADSLLSSEKNADMALMAATLSDSAENAADLNIGSEVRKDTAEKIATMRELEKTHMRLVLEATKWQKDNAAQILGISRKTLYRKILDFGLTPSNPASSLNVTRTKTKPPPGK